MIYPDISKWRKDTFLLLFIHCTLYEKLNVSADGLTFTTTCVDKSYAVHDDTRGHTGGCMNLGSGIIHCKSSKQKLSTKSSAECEVVGASDYLPFTVYMKYFIEAQGYQVRKNDINQDNQASIKLENVGRASSGQKTRRIHIKYFFMKDRIRRDEINIIYCTTEIMVVNYFTKPLQGVLFKSLRIIIMG